jgi:hypothetical protein
MSVSSTKAGTGAGAVLVINATAATLAVPAVAPAQPPTAFTVAPASTPTGIAILQMKDFTMPSQKWSYDDVTNTSSPAVGVGVLKESLATLVDPGEFSCTGVFLPSDPGLLALQTAFTTGLANAFQVQLQPLGGQSTSGNVYAFNAYVQENPIPSNISAEKAVTIKISLKLDSVITTKAGA